VLGYLYEMSFFLAGGMCLLLSFVVEDWKLISVMFMAFAGLSNPICKIWLALSWRSSDAFFQPK
jgi:hypothetical protein